MVESEGAANATKIRQQIEYYLSDANLVRDKFFREQILTDKEGYVAISHFLNCNKVKEMKINADQIASAIADSSEVDLSEDKTKVRRAGNKALPEKQDRRRD